MYHTLYTHMVQINTVGDWASIFSIVGVIIALGMAAYSIYRTSKKEGSDTFARQDIVSKDFQLVNKRIDDHEKMNSMEFSHFKELLEEVKCTTEDMNGKIDILIQRK